MGFLEVLPHLIGMAASLFVLATFRLFYHAWSMERTKMQLLNGYSIELGKAQDHFRNSELDFDAQLKLVQWMLEKHSSDHFKNRLSDLLGVIWKVLSWFTWLVIVCLLLATIYTMAGEGTWKPVIYWWGYVVFSIVWFGLAFVYSFVCRVLTNRNPGAAKLCRKEFEKHYNEVLEAKEQQADENADNEGHDKKWGLWVNTSHQSRPGH